MKLFKSIFSLETSSLALLLILYTILIHVLYIVYYKYSFELSYNGLLFIFDFSAEKYLFCLLETILILLFSIKNLQDSSFSAITMAILNCLYFIPGCVQQAVTNEPWGYIMFFFSFWVFMEIWLKIIKPIPLFPFLRIFKVKNKEKYLYIVSVVTIFLALSLMFYHGRSFSMSNFQETLLDVYGVRAEATLAKTHWIIVNIQLWCAYFIVLMTTYFSIRRKWIIVIFLVVAEIALFLIAANRIFLFFEIAAILVGVLKINTKHIAFLMTIISLGLLVEVNIIDIGLVFNDVFRRFAIVPNRISGFYYDYFSFHSPDYLKSLYDRFFSFLGMHSYYADHPISRIIGDNYLGWEVGCNTGMVGGSMFCFGFGALLFSTFGYIMTFRIYEGAISGFNNPSMNLIFSVVLASLAINTYAFLANFINLSYFILLYISLSPICNTNLLSNRTK